jgi:hypothetical protein
MHSDSRLYYLFLQQSVEGFLLQLTPDYRESYRRLWLLRSSQQRLSGYFSIYMILRIVKRVALCAVCIGLGINSSVQPVLFVIESDHGLVNRSLPRTPPSFGLRIDLVNLAVNGRPSSFDTKYIKY